MNEFRGMAYLCPNGHRWAADAFTTFSSLDARPDCPSCGQPGRLQTNPTAPVQPVVPAGDEPEAEPRGLEKAASQEVANDRRGDRRFEASPAPSVPASDPPAPPSVASIPPTSAGQNPRPSLISTSGAASLPLTPSSMRQSPTLPVFAGYATLAVLGRGGMGIVYRARHQKLKRVVALKMIVIPTQDEPRFLERFQAEAEAVARLHHPNIVEIFEIGEQDGSPFLALEYVNGGNLRDRLGGKPQPIRAAVELMAEIARAVHVAHRRGIIHLDLKPANILLQPVIGNEDTNASAEALEVYGIPKVGDFGLARRIDDEGDGCIPGEIIGTPAYMAPEQALGKASEIGVASDVYALGVILYEMLTGSLPFSPNPLNEMVRKLASEPPPGLRSLRPGLSRDLEAVVLRCLEKDPRRRYRSAQALADELDRYLSGEPVRARPPSPVGRLWNWSLKNPAPTTLLLTITAVLLYGQWSLRRVASVMVETTSRNSASQQTRLLKEMNALYTDVATRARASGITVTHRYPEVDKSIPIPVKFTIELGKRMQDMAEASDDHAREIDQSFTQLRVYSGHPFRQRTDSPPKSKFGKDALEFFLDPANQDKAYEKIEKNRNGGRSLRYATPLIMLDRCLKCHNDPTQYEIDQYRKTDWKNGDVRGVLEIVCPLEETASETEQALVGTYVNLGAIAAGVLSSSWLALFIGRRKRRERSGRGST